MARPIVSPEPSVGIKYGVPGTLVGIKYDVPGTQLRDGDSSRRASTSEAAQAVGWHLRRVQRFLEALRRRIVGLDAD